LDTTNSSLQSGYLFGVEICNATHVHQCFRYDNSKNQATNQCVLKDCHIIFKESNKLMCADGKKSHKTAAYFSYILHLFGIGRFYIDHHILGGLQLFHTLIAILAVLSYFLKIEDFIRNKLKLIKINCRNISKVHPINQDEEPRSRVRRCIACMCSKKCIRIIVTLIISIGRLIWWVVDSILFAKKAIKDEDGCVLYDDMVEL